jgi:HAD superfamily 5'-nucleotidase-like hydrolase
MESVQPGRGVYCNRTLNLRAIRAIGYDMDYTLVHYHETAWELRAFEHVRARFAADGWPVAHLKFDPSFINRGLIVDVERGNLVKANRFGFIKRAAHGTRVLDFEELRKVYARTIVDLSEPRWIFLNTLFSLSEGSIYAQLVELLDQNLLPGPMGYPELYKAVKDKLDRTHVEGELKAEVVADPARYVELDPAAALALLDQKRAGKKLMLITNSEWDYTNAMMRFAFDRYLPEGMGFRDLFDIIIVGAGKPGFFTANNNFFEIANEEGLLRPLVGQPKFGGAYFGGSAARLERALGLSGDEILYVGDHLFGDMHVTKRVLHWRTALILRELENEVAVIERSRSDEKILEGRMREKEALEREANHIRLELQRIRGGYGPQGAEPQPALEARAEALRTTLAALDHEIAPLAKAAAELSHPVWGLLTRAGNDKSHLARQIERYADIYTSRVSNFLQATPFVYLRSPRGTLPHDGF